MALTKEDAIQTIIQHRDDIAELGVAAIGLIGSVARGEAHVASDLDVVIDLPPEHQTLREYFAIIDYLEAQFGSHVDVLMLDTLRPRFRRAIERDVVWIDLGT
ncbi:MAG: nucleotidyltransferase domain-containing protein [Chloroflexota bacterium]|nr:nucleotidyltransferase domain-containing protein [Chloroflexota bacterium]MDE2840431.1 nucleotidyltransferase domain-containing protein [Chloroflexota bacterium]MDE2931692.1 nucleotidyltransferase domain-containing protein [Chloroflexota bacterium]